MTLLRGRPLRTIYLVALLGVTVSAASAATIESLNVNKTTIGKYERYELTFQLGGVSPSGYNPFRPETSGDALSPAGVDVRAEITTPSGAVKRIWGFYDVDYAYMGNMTKTQQSDKERMIPISSPHWHVRYAPTELGSYRVVVKVTDAGGTTTSSQMSFTCVESGRKGFLRVSDDGTRMVYSDGSPFVPFGTMQPYGTEKVAATVAAMKANGMNYLRRWLVDRDKEDMYREMESWSGYSSDTSIYRSGKRSATKAITGSGVLVDQSFIGCKPGTYYKAYAYLRTSSDFNGQVAVSLVEDRADGSTSTKTGNGVGSGQNWAYSEVIFQTAANAEMIHFKPRIVSGSTGKVWIDDVGLYQCDSSGNKVVDYNMVFNSSFEQWNPAQLRMVALGRFEYLLQQCEANGIVVQPAIFNYRLWNAANPTGFYAQFFGDFFTDPTSIAQQRRVLRYLIARFSSYTSLANWELTNEMDASYTDVRGTWLSGHADFLHQNDPQGHPVTMSLWSSPGDYRYWQMPAMDVGQVHFYINTEEKTNGNDFPAWWSLPSTMVIETNIGNVASGSRSLKAGANGSTISDSANVYCRPGESFTVRCKIKTSGVTGQASVIIQPFGGSSAGSGPTLSSTGTAGFTSRSQTFTTGSTAQGFKVIVQLTGSSGTAWWDDIEVINNDTGTNCLYNGGFESPSLGDDELDWAMFLTTWTNQVYGTGANGTEKVWLSGEFGLMGDNYDLSYWARTSDTTKPRHDTTGIHVHNCVWAQLVASSAMNTPTYWWVDEYIVKNSLHGAWKGATSFAANLPFYGQGKSVCTQPGVGDVLATSSASKIRALGQKSTSSGYFWIQNKDHTWSRVVRDGVTPTPTSATITVPGFDTGTYTLNWYDAYTGGLVKTETQSVGNGNLSLSVSSLATDIAVVATRLGAPVSQPNVKLTLVADKTTVVPSDVITYTVTYTNTGSGTASNVVITLPIPANTTLVTGSATNGGTYDPASRTVRWTLPSLSAGATGQCSAKVQVQ